MLAVRLNATPSGATELRDNLDETTQHGMHRDASSQTEVSVATTGCQIGKPMETSLESQRLQNINEKLRQKIVALRKTVNKQRMRRELVAKWLTLSVLVRIGYK